MYMEKLESIQDLKKKGYQIEPNGILIQNHLKEILEQREITVIELAEKTGMSRQTLHNIINGTYSPGVEMSLKIATVLRVPVEEIFQLKEEAWFSRVKKAGEKNLYVDVLNLVIMDKEAMTEDVKNNGFLYYDTLKQTMITEEQLNEWKDREYELLLKSPSKWPHLLGREDEEEKIDKRSIHRLLKEKVGEISRERFIPKYQKLVKIIPR